jgi:CheY-like chemotaxis protein
MRDSLQRRATCPAHDVEEREVSKPLAGFRILVVDDEASVRRLLERILTRGGAGVAQTGFAHEAFAALRTFRPHLLISDINMPTENGYELMRRIRAVDEGWAARLPAIALTGGGGVANSVEARRAGFSAYLNKPFLPSALLDAVLTLLPVHASEC